ncbi:hypothetical protein GY45DRAFT_373823 [Cubamyces sp. BRFM 1775]|nr:hypothetical protein GY45DRAFT_373823 [Cubamyces sp. BRFM 1775]
MVPKMRPCWRLICIIYVLCGFFSYEAHKGTPSSAGDWFLPLLQITGVHSLSSRNTVRSMTTRDVRCDNAHAWIGPCLRLLNPPLKLYYLFGEFHPSSVSC